MRRWIWGGSAVALLLVWALVAAPGTRFQAAPEPAVPGDPAMDPNGQPNVDAIRALGADMDEIELMRVESFRGGLVEVDARYVGPNPPNDQAAWNLAAKDIANELSRSPANTQTIMVNLYQDDTLQAQAVTSRAE